MALGAGRRRRPQDRNAVSVSRRSVALTVNERLALLRAAARMRQLGEFLQLAVLAVPAAVPLLIAQRNAIRARCDRVLHYDYTPPPRRTAAEVWAVRTIAAASERCRSRDWLFEQVFGCGPDEAQELLDNDFTGTAPFAVQRRGQISPECALLVLLHRQQSTMTTLVSMAELFGTDAATLSAFLDVIEEYVDQRWGRLVSIDRVHKFNHRFGMYREAMVKTYAEHIGRPVWAMLMLVVTWTLGLTGAAGTGAGILEEAGGEEGSFGLLMVGDGRSHHSGTTVDAHGESEGSWVCPVEGDGGRAMFLKIRLLKRKFE